MELLEPLQKAIEEISKLPSIGKKTAQRLAIFILKSEPEQVENLLSALKDLKTKVKFCEVCFNLSVENKCTICRSQKRDITKICVVEEPSDIFALERTNEYNGLYHVLGGVLSPLSGRGAESLRIRELTERISMGDVKEIILAMNPTTEGEATILYLAKYLRSSNIKISRIARGLPVGGNIEFADQATIGRALLGRSELE
ncbi:MAG: recombination mediator RecR [Ignavibacteriales bacterium]|nr:recombination mediator RecR [Ignavibacteriales bacterium]MCF8306912.1 recombination mediator RecR [Ignavibacteriales bacterium]MCF8438142.1 recombination mediator RecR [Ignavibacteriales bacterium]